MAGTNQDIANKGIGRKVKFINYDGNYECTEVLIAFDDGTAITMYADSLINIYFTNDKGKQEV